TVWRRYVWAPMDNLAHTLVGAALGRAIAGHRIRGAGLVGAVAGNAPDWTELLAAPGVGPPRSGLTYLEWHRGITHSLLGAAIEIAATGGRRSSAAGPAAV